MNWLWAPSAGGKANAHLESQPRLETLELGFQAWPGGSKTGSPGAISLSVRPYHLLQRFHAWTRGLGLPAATDRAYLGHTALILGAATGAGQEQAEHLWSDRAMATVAWARADHHSSLHPGRARVPCWPLMLPATTGTATLDGDSPPPGPSSRRGLALQGGRSRGVTLG